MKESEQMGRNLNREKLHLVAVKGGSSRYEFKRSGRSGRSGTFKLFSSFKQTGSSSGLFCLSRRQILAWKPKPR